jgi:putative hydrolase of the HAD superfamily
LTDHCSQGGLRVVLFDFGGVLLRLRDPVESFGIGATLAEFNRRWIASPAVIAHESGHIGAEAFGKQIVREMQLQYSWQEFIARFDAWPDRISDATAALVKSIPLSLRCAILSNTNALHWAAQDIDGVFEGRIEHCFLSFENGLMKPQPAAFHQVIDTYGCAAQAILFIDDNPVNIDAALATGMRARLCTGVDTLGEILCEEGVFPA